MKVNNFTRIPAPKDADEPVVITGTLESHFMKSTINIQKWNRWIKKTRRSARQFERAIYVMVGATKGSKRQRRKILKQFMERFYND